MSPVDRYSTYRDSTIHDEDARTARHISRRPTLNTVEQR